MRLFLSAILPAALVAFSAAAAHAARVGPRPTLVLMDEGYGVLAAEVSRAEPSPEPRNAAEQYAITFRGSVWYGDWNLFARTFADEYDVTFRVRAVYAQPVAGGPFPVGPGDPIRVRLSAGYAAQVEWNLPHALAPGERFILTVKRVGGDRYKHADGASAAVGVEAFADADRDRYVGLRELAWVPLADRPARWVAVAADDANSDALRSDVLVALDAHEVRRALTPEQNAAATAGLRALWNDPRPAFSPDLLDTLDYVLRGTDHPAFVGSADRARVWAARLLAPTPANLRDDNDRDNLALSMLRDLLASRPQIVGPPSVAALCDARWPEGFPPGRRGCPDGRLRVGRRPGPVLGARAAGPLRPRADLRKGVARSPRGRGFDAGSHEQGPSPLVPPRRAGAVGDALRPGRHAGPGRVGP